MTLSATPRSWVGAVFIAITFALGSAIVYGARPSQSTSSADYVIVELNSPAAARYQGGIKGLAATARTQSRFDPDSPAYYNYRRHLEDEHAKFRAALNHQASQAEVVNESFITANAVVLKLNGVAADRVKRIQGVKRVHESTLYRMHMDQSNGLIGADEAWEFDGRQNAGNGVRVGVIDSGITNSLIPGSHPFFNCKDVVFGGLFFSGVTGLPAIGIKSENGAEPAPGLVYDSDHGTHVAGTVGGCTTTVSGGPWDGTELSGVAPGATLVDYNVFPGIGAGYVAFGGSAFSHDIAAAIEASVANGDHVINMSLGGGAQGPHDFLAEVSNAAVAAGTVVVTSAGNEGPDPYTVGSPGVALDVITVGASTNTRGMSVELRTPDNQDPPVKAYAGEFPNFDGSDQTAIVWPGSDPEACSSDVDNDTLTGEVVVIARGTCSFSQKVENANLAGAGGVVVYSDDREPGGMAKTDGFDDDIPAVMVSNTDGLALVAEIDAAGGSLAISISPPLILPETPNLLADFSSRGPSSFTGIVKPDVLAPGVNILSSVFTGWELFNGTSMASPHVAGAVAILLQQHPDWTPAQVKSALASTANGVEGLTPWEQGSGIVDLPAALATNAFFTPTNASFGVFTGKAPANGSIEITIDSAEDCNLASLTGNYIDGSVTANVLTMDFDAGRTEPAGTYGGYAKVDCNGQNHTIPWGAVVSR